MGDQSRAGDHDLKRPSGGTQGSSRYSNDSEHTPAQHYQQLVPRQALTPLSHAQQPSLPASQVMCGPEAQQQQQTCDLPKEVAEQQKHIMEPELVVRKRGRTKASGSRSAKARSTNKRTLVEMVEEVVSG